ncbi:MAG: carboxynorspermidine decarboxylase [Lachnospiraceae bacterium]|nr:carboxynorspermidine decarboxylase [Lachnospiraceae bacterium]
MTIEQIETPAYVIDEEKLEENLKILSEVQEKSGCRILLAQKAFSAFCTYPLIGRYLAGATASGLYEARLGKEEMGKENHVFSPAYKEEEMKELAGICDHIIFNSMTQLSKHKDACLSAGVSIGLRINPECSTQEHAMYDPCGPFSRLGIRAKDLPEKLPEYVSGLHFHTLCEQNADALETTLAAVEEKFGQYLKTDQIRWLNMGGGHHITRKDYDRDKLITLICRIRETYGVEVYLEPGEAVALDAGYLVTAVLDRVDNNLPILILDASAACHMPDVLEVPYTPPLKGAKILETPEKPEDIGKGAFGKQDNSGQNEPGNPEKSGENDREHGEICMLGARTCLAGDVIGTYRFDRVPRVGERLYFGDMAIYSMVKNNTFNGMELPAIYLRHKDGNCEKIKEFGYQDFKERLS